MASASRILGVLLLLGAMGAGAAATDADTSDAEDRALEATIAELHSGSKEQRRFAVQHLRHPRNRWLGHEAAGFIMSR